MQDIIVVIHPRDNVGVVTRQIKKGEKVSRGKENAIEARDDIPKNHKVALVEIPKSSPVVKYGEKIGFAKEDIHIGQWVHTHNLKAQEE